MTSRTALRLRAAAWTSAVAIVPSAFLLTIFYVAQGYQYRDDIPLILAIAVISPVAAGVSGFAYGWPLVNPAAPHDTSDAIVTGLKVTLWAHGLLSITLSVTATAIGVFQMISSGLRQPEISFFWGMPLITIFIFLGSLWFFGWITLPLGGAAGYWLSQHYRASSAS